MTRQIEYVTEYFNSMNVRDTPTYKAMLALASHPQASYPKPGLVASCVDISISESTFESNTKPIMALLDSFVKVLNQIWYSFKTDFSYDNEEELEQIFLNYVKRMNIKL